MRLQTKLMLLVEKLLLFPFREFVRRTSADPHFPVAQVYRKTAQDAADFIIPHLQTATLYTHRFQLMDHTIAMLPKEGHLVEFGVFKGQSLDYFASFIGSRMITGFDSFEGLKEDWGGSDKAASAFNQGGKIPKVPRNAKLVKGWFDQSLPGWLSQNPGNFALIHIDSDTYEACKCVFELCRDRITNETLILFDEHHGYPGWRFGEFKALNEFLEKHKLRCTYLGFSDTGALIRVHT